MKNFDEKDTRTVFTQFNNDQWSSFFWLVFGVVICISSVPYGMGSLHNPGAGFVPFLSGLAVSIFSIIGFVESTVKQKKGQRWRSPMTEGTMWGKVLFAVADLFAYAFLLAPLGFTLCTALCVSFLLRIGKFYPWRVAIAGGIAAAFATYGIFVVLLKVQFPKGPWGF